MSSTVRDFKRKKWHASKNRNPRPNHFFAVQISDCQVLYPCTSKYHCQFNDYVSVQIVENVHNVHRTILEQEPQLSSTLVSTSTLHITLALAHLSSTRTEDLVR